MVDHHDAYVRHYFDLRFGRSAQEMAKESCYCLVRREIHTSVRDSISSCDRMSRNKGALITLKFHLSLQPVENERDGYIGKGGERKVSLINISEVMQ